MDHSNKQDDDQERLKQERARGRWKILRQALLSNANKNPNKASHTTDIHSIHRFSGYNLLPSPTTVSFPMNEELASILASSPSCSESSCDERTLDDTAFLSPNRMVDSLRTIVIKGDKITETDDSSEACSKLVADPLEQSLQALFSLLDATSLADRQQLDIVFQLQMTSCPSVLPLDSNRIHHLLCKSTVFKDFTIKECGISDSCTANNGSATFKERSAVNAGFSLSLKLIRTDSTRIKPSQLHVVQKYALPSDTTHRQAFVLTRERTALHRPTLLELASHQRNKGVDNTGNVCIWDSEKTLTWALHRYIAELSKKQETRQLNDIRVVTELGVGMAGLAALSLTQCPDLPCLSNIALTDGHMDCVRNNAINVRLMKAAKRIPDSCSVQACQLLWSSHKAKLPPGAEATVDSVPPLADWTLISDCTHFEEFHACLLWTLVNSTKVSGRIWMCQPNRGTSLQRFLRVVEAVNRGSNQSSSETSTSPLLKVSEQFFPTLDEMHEEFVKNDSHYDPNIHRPRIFVLDKVREATEADRLVAIEHVKIRDLPRNGIGNK